jgi:hypothetical protein
MRLGGVVMYPYHWEMAHKGESARPKERKETLDNSMDAAQRAPR